jgi:ABC-2 type transport system ATP-binding protein
MIEVRELRVDYDEVCAVRDLTLSIPAGQIYGLIGPNGAGKTTTLRALVGLKEATYGDISLNGSDLMTQREEAVAVAGFMPDSAPVYPELTVWEYLDLFAASYFIPKHERASRIDQYLALVDLSSKRDALTAGLSRGMRQRLLLAKALLPDPLILLLDEPASGMDPYGRALLKDCLVDLAAKGKAVLISSHILPDLADFCTAIGVMEKGRLVETGTVTEVAARVLGAMRMALEVVSGAELCERVLAGDDQVSDIRQHNGSFSFIYAGDKAAVGELTAKLINAGVRLASFGQEKEDLEEVFLKIGAKEVS